MYLDLAFFDLLHTRFGAKGGAFAEAYVLAHEYGHHVQDLFGALNQIGASSATGPESESVQVELQADCLAGVWAYHATETGYLTEVTDEEIAESLDAVRWATTVSRTRPRAMFRLRHGPDGSSEQRQLALKDGLRTGALSTCDTLGWTP